MATMDIELTDVGKTWIQEHYPQSNVWKYDVDKPFNLHAWAAEFIETARARIEVKNSCTV